MFFHRLAEFILVAFTPCQSAVIQPDPLLAGQVSLLRTEEHGQKNTDCGSIGLLVPSAAGNLVMSVFKTQAFDGPY